MEEKAKSSPPRKECTTLDLLLVNGREIWRSLSVFQSLIYDLGSDAEIINDALHLYLKDCDFGCPEDAAKAIMWCLFLDASGFNSLRKEYDVLRNGVAVSVLNSFFYSRSDLEVSE